MSARLPAALLVSALLRQVNDAGGSATIVAKGDPDSGAMLIQTMQRGVPGRMFERGIGSSGKTELLSVGPDPGDSPAVAEWLARRRRSDPDLWIVELDIADAERFAAETILGD